MHGGKLSHYEEMRPETEKKIVIESAGESEWQSRDESGVSENFVNCPIVTSFGVPIPIVACPEVILSGTFRCDHPAQHFICAKPV